MNTNDTQPYIKWLYPDGTPAYGGTGHWPLPTARPDGSWVPGEALKVAGDIIPRRNGLHLCRLRDAVIWLMADVVPFLAQYRGPLVPAHNKVVVGEARLVRVLAWDDRLARLFAADCAERALDLYGGTVNPRSRAAVSAARLYANGEIGAVAGAAGAVRDAAGAAQAARDAALAAAGAAARDAEKQWQGTRLWAYFTGQTEWQR